jgi:S1-C subfamily serine protease
MAEEIPAGGPPAPHRSDRTRARLGRLAPYAVGALTVIMAILLYDVLAPGPPPISQGDVNDTVANALASVTPPPAYSQEVFQAVEPSVVLIETTTAKTDAKTGNESGLGSGVVVDASGDILTALHVVADASEISLTFADGSKSGAEVVTREPQNDIAVIRATDPPVGIAPATLGNPGAVREGNEAFALGSPFGLGGSISAGVISGLGRSFKLPDSDIVLHGLFQIDAAVNPGNSGGPLVDRQGDVIGIVTALVNPTKDDVFIGIGLAVPIDVAGGAAGLPPY